MSRGNERRCESPAKVSKATCGALRQPARSLTISAHEALHGVVRLRSIRSAKKTLVAVYWLILAGEEQLNQIMPSSYNAAKKLREGVANHPRKILKEGAAHVDLASSHKEAATLVPRFGRNDLNTFTCL